MGTLLTFSAGVTQFGWFHAGDLSSCSAHTAWLSFIRLVNQQSFGAGGERNKELLQTCLHLQNEIKDNKNWNEKEKKSVDMFSLLIGWMCVMSSIVRFQCIQAPRKS